jgi:hypothetical protein
MIQAALFADLPPVLARVRDPIREASLSDGCRWYAKRAWGAGPCALWCGANPSDADGLRDDPSMQRMMDFSLRNGFGSLVVINAVPHQSSQPDDAIAWWKRINWDNGPTPEAELWQRNINECVPLLLATKTRIAIWGNCLPPEIIADFLECLACAVDADWGDDEFAPVQWLCLGTNANGTPRHPLARGKSRIPDTFQPIKWK